MIYTVGSTSVFANVEPPRYLNPDPSVTNTHSKHSLPGKMGGGATVVERGKDFNSEKVITVNTRVCQATEPNVTLISIYL